MRLLCQSRRALRGVAGGFMLALSAGGLLAVPAGAARAQTATLSNIFTVMPGLTTDAQPPTNPFVRGSAGRTGVLTMELDDQYDAVQIGVENGLAASWGIDRIVVAPSASYGSDQLLGEAPHDLDGNVLSEMLPVTFGNGGANSPPPAASGTLLSLPLEGAITPGLTKLSFVTTAAAPAYGSASPQHGWYVADGLGCIAPGTQVKTVTATDITLSMAVTGTGCGQGQAVYFSASPFGPFQQTIPAMNAADGSGSITFSDWLPMSSLPRTDSGFAIGAALTGAGLAPGTTLTGTGSQELLLSQPLIATVPPRTPITASVAVTTSANAAAGHTTIKVASTKGLQVGQTLSGNPGLASGTHVAHLTATNIEIDKPLAGMISSGSMLVSSGTVWTAAAGQVGDTALHVPSLSTRPLLHIRYFTSAGTAPNEHVPSCQVDPGHDAVPCEEPLGLAPVWDEMSGLGADGVNYIGQVAGTAGHAQPSMGYPSFFIRFRGKHQGATLLVCGGFQVSGAAGSVSGEATVASIAAAAMTKSNPSLPITVTDVAAAGLDTDPNFADCREWLPAIQPSMLMQQDYSNHNSATIPYYMSNVEAIGDQAIAQGTQPIVYLAYPENTALVGELPVAGPVTNSRVVPLLAGANSDVSPTDSLVTGPGVPPGTTGTMSGGQWYIVLSRAVSLPAGAVLDFGYQVASVAPDGLSFTLAYNAFQTKDNNKLVGTGVPAHDLVTTKQNSLAASVTAPITSPPGTLLTTSFPINAMDGYLTAAQEYRTMTGDPWAAVQLDSLLVVSTDPVNANELCRGCTTQGLYGNDYANNAIAAAFIPILQTLTGQ